MPASICRYTTILPTILETRHSVLEKVVYLDHFGFFNDFKDINCTDFFVPFSHLAPFSYH